MQVKAGAGGDDKKTDAAPSTAGAEGRTVRKHHIVCQLIGCCHPSSIPPFPVSLPPPLSLYLLIALVAIFRSLWFSCAVVFLLLLICLRGGVGCHDRCGKKSAWGLAGVSGTTYRCCICGSITIQQCVLVEVVFLLAFSPALVASLHGRVPFANQPLKIGSYSNKTPAGFL